MIYNLVKYLVQTQLRLWDIKISNFKLESYPCDLLKICYFYISQTKSSLDKIFYKIVYYYITYMCDFFGEFRRLFCRGLHGFSRRLWFSLDTFTSSWPVDFPTIKKATKRAPPSLCTKTESKKRKITTEIKKETKYSQQIPSHEQRCQML